MSDPTFSGDSPSRHFLPLVPAVLESQNQDCPAHIKTNHTHTVYKAILHCSNRYSLHSYINMKSDKMQAWCTVFLINLLSFVSLFTLYSLGACGADWTNVSLTNRKYAHTCTHTQNVNQHDLSRRHTTQNKTKRFTLNGTLWTEIIRRPIQWSLQSLSKANERKS